MFDFQNVRNKPIFKIHKKFSSVADIIDTQLLSYGTRPAVRYDTGEHYESISFKDYHAYVKAAIAFFQNQGVEQKIIATFCKNRIEWDMIALGAFYTANILFPLDTKTNSRELEHLLQICPPDYILVSIPQLERFRQTAKNIGLTARVLVADLISVFEDIGAPRSWLQENEISFTDVIRQSISSDPVMPSPLLAKEDTVLGHYPTSGTTNLPKIVQITHGNIVHEVNCAMDVLNLRPNEDLLNIGPYTHIATLVEFLVTKTRGFTVTYFTREPDEDDVLEDEIAKLRKQKVRIKALLAVPKFWIYLMKEVLEEMKNKPVLNRLYHYLISIEKNDNLHDIGTVEKAKLTAVRTLLRNKLGGYFSYGISSSMKLDGAIVKIFGKLGITVIDIYGATECTGIIARNKLNDITAGSCGRIIDLLEYKVDNFRAIPGWQSPVGTLKLKGPTIARGYIAKAGREPLHLDNEGYYNTGDLCTVDSSRILWLVGREKELIRWDDGSFIDPQHLSNLLVRSIFVKDGMVARRRIKDAYLSVFLFPNYKRLYKDPAWKKEIDTGVSEKMALKSRMIAAIRYAESIAGITPELNKETIYLLPRKLERTPTHKIKFIFELERIDQSQSI